MSNPALLLLGPTASGKTPLGELLQDRGLWGRRCVHFDFGATLREAVARDRPDGVLSREDLDFLRGVLQSGALLEDEHFDIARRLLEDFLRRRAAETAALVVLNGLPRHAGQAEAVARLVDVRHVVVLRCDAATVLQRVRRDAGGDRAGREDDDPAAVRAKLALYEARTAPLVEHYRQAGAEVVEVDVTAEMTAAAVWEALENRGNTNRR